MTTDDFTALPDLASRALGGSVSAANDELFAQRENLIKAEAPFFDPNEFGHKGKVYDGWENPSPPRRWPRLRHRTARHTRNHPRNHRRHCVFQGQLPAVRLDRGCLDRGISLRREELALAGEDAPTAIALLD